MTSISRLVPTAARPLVLAALLALASLSMPAAVHAQDAAAPAVVLALADSLPVANARAVVLFRSRPTGQHVIVLSTTTATPETIGGALALVARLQREHANDDLSAVVPISAIAPRRSLSASRQSQLASYLSTLRAQPRTRLGNVGTGRWVELRAAALPR